MLHSVDSRDKSFHRLVKPSQENLNIHNNNNYISVSRPERECLLLTGSAGTGKTVMLAEALKIKVSKLKQQNTDTDVKIFVTTFHAEKDELLDKYRNNYLVNIENINTTNIEDLSSDLNVGQDFATPRGRSLSLSHNFDIKKDDATPQRRSVSLSHNLSNKNIKKKDVTIQRTSLSTHQKTLQKVVRSLSAKYTDSVVILLCDEVQCWDSSNWSDMKTCHNVIWLLAFNPCGDFQNMVPSDFDDDVLFRQLLIRYRNCYQIRLTGHQITCSEFELGIST